MGLSDYYLTGLTVADIDDMHDDLIDDLVTAKLVSGHSSEVDSSMILIRNLLRHFFTGGELTYSSATAITVAPLTCLIGDTPVQVDVVTTLTLTEDSDWVDGSANSFSGGAGCVYVYVKTDGTIALSETAPTYSDGLGTQVGKYRYLKDGSNDYWRCIGALAVTTSDEFVKFYQDGDMIYYDSYQNVFDDASVATFTDIDCSEFVPAFALSIVVTAYLDQASPSGALEFWFRCDDSSGDGIRLHGVGTSEQFIVPCDSTQTIEYKCESAGRDIKVDVCGYSLSGIRG